MARPTKTDPNGEADWPQIPNLFFFFSEGTISSIPFQGLFRLGIQRGAPLCLLVHHQCAISPGVARLGAGHRSPSYSREGARVAPSSVGRGELAEKREVEKREGQGQVNRGLMVERERVEGERGDMGNAWMRPGKQSNS